MEKLLLKMARQLDALDEASLLDLWDKYAFIVNKFEPTKRWEEATIIFSLIQAKRFKNQLFNFQLASQATPYQNASNLKTNFSLEREELEEVVEPKKATILKFTKPKEQKK